MTERKHNLAEELNQQIVDPDWPWWVKLILFFVALKILIAIEDGCKGNTTQKDKTATQSSSQETKEKEEIEPRVTRLPFGNGKYKEYTFKEDAMGGEGDTLIRFYEKPGLYLLHYSCCSGEVNNYTLFSKNLGYEYSLDNSYEPQFSDDQRWFFSVETGDDDEEIKPYLHIYNTDDGIVKLIYDDDSERWSQFNCTSQAKLKYAARWVNNTQIDFTMKDKENRDWVYSVNYVNRKWIENKSASMQLNPQYQQPAPQVEPIHQQIRLTKQDFMETSSGVPFEMKYLKKNEFQMGCSDNDAYYDNYKPLSELPVHTVRLNEFYIGKYEVTFAEYDKYCDATGRKKTSDEGWGRGNRPVINVSWDDAVTYCKWLSGMTRKTYRLPTEAEWEYSARGGETHKYAGSNDINVTAWCDNNSSKMTHPVGQKRPNGFGLYDMVGNAFEWCADWYWCDMNGGYKISNGVTITNPTGAANGIKRVLRGGCWAGDYILCRVTSRGLYEPSIPEKNFGFRVVCIP
jgi:formylglycine-generating enzyme required for sulfatase activity